MATASLVLVLAVTAAIMAVTLACHFDVTTLDYRVSPGCPIMEQPPDLEALKYVSFKSIVVHCFLHRVT